MVDDGARYESKSVRALRGTEARSIAKWQKDGWELVDQSVGALHATLEFRRPKPPLPVRQILIGGAVALVLAMIIGVMALLEDGGGNGDSLSTEPTPVMSASSEPTLADAPAVEPTPSATEEPDSPPAPVTDTTVDELLDRLNSADMGGVELGDRFKLTAELVTSEFWGTGASGDYFVLLKAKDGANDLQVFVEESEARAWRDGTRVEMVVESVEITIDGETTDGWLRAESVETLGG